ncbi:hypothetical protein [Thalassobacillus hwangdonensis]|uniref:Uncharacterized protein n=1 Tax=Thalassobacillus hwangdonensis TaxID=546108 RepID=A0ABW3L0Y1_9BACI
MTTDSNQLDSVLAFLDIAAILLVEEEPLLSILFVVLLKVVTKDEQLRILFLLLLICLSILPVTSET